MKKQRRPMTPLRLRMEQDLQLRNYAPKIIERYVECVAAFAKHFRRFPEKIFLC